MLITFDPSVVWPSLPLVLVSGSRGAPVPDLPGAFEVPAI